MKLHRVLALGAFTVTLSAAGAGQAANLISNGDFETGDFSGWTVDTQAGSAGALYVQANNGGGGQGTAINPAGGDFFALTAQPGPGSYALTQIFSVLGGAYFVDFDLFANDYSGTVFPGRDYTVDPTQNAVADILRVGADPFSDNPADLKALLYGPGADLTSPPPNPWTRYHRMVNLAPGTYKIRFAETDNQSFFNLGVDNVSITAAGGVGPVPEPATWALMLTGFGLLGVVTRRQRRPVEV